MALSVNPTEIWDFQAASTPLVGQLLGATFVLSADVTVDTTSGITIPTNTFRAASIAVANLPSALLATRPVTFVVGVRYTNTNSIQAHSNVIGYGSGQTHILGVTMNTSESQTNTSGVTLHATAGSGLAGISGPTIAKDAEAVLVCEHTPTTVKLWTNAVLGPNQTGTYTTVPSPATLVLGKDNGTSTRATYPFLAIFHEPLSPNDITALGASFSAARSALFDPPPPSNQRYRHHHGTAPGRFPSGT